MVKVKNTIILNAGVRKNGTSTSFAQSILQLMDHRGQQGTLIHMINYFDGKPIKHLKKSIAESDLIGVVVPCYVNTLPYSSIACLEQLVEGYEDEFKGKDIFVVVQGGMPYLDVHEPCMDTLRLFAKKTKMNWLGGIICGIGPIVDGKPLGNCGGMGKKYLRGLELLVEDVLASQPIRPEVQKKVSFHIPTIAAYPMSWLLNYGGKKLREEKGVVDFDRKPYL